MQRWRLVEEECFPQVAEVLVFAAELMHQIGVFEIDYINLSQGAHVTRFAAE